MSKICIVRMLTVSLLIQPFGCHTRINVMLMYVQAFSALTLYSGGKGIWPVKKLSAVRVLAWLSDCDEGQSCIRPS